MWKFLTKVSASKTVRRNQHRGDRHRLRPGLEVLEDRTAPALLNLSLIGGVLHYNATAGVANDLRVSHASGRYSFSDVEPITLFGAFVAPVGSGTNSVSFSDAGINWITVDLKDKNDTLLVKSVIDPLNVNAGLDDDNVTVLSTAAATTIDGNDGNDWINLGGRHDVTPPLGGSLDGILAPVTIRGSAGSDDRLWVNDWADPDLNTYTITSTRVSRAGVAIDYDTSVESLRLNEGFSACTVNVWSTSPATALTVNLKAGGADTVHIGSPNRSLDTIQGPVTILGEVGTDPNIVPVDSVYLHDEFDGNANAYTLAVSYSTDYAIGFPSVIGTVARSGAALITYKGGLARLTVNAGQYGDSILVASTGVLAPVTVNAGAGNDKFNVGAGGSVAGIRGRLTVNGQEGFDTLSIDGRADGPDPFVRDLTTVRRSGRILLSYSSIEDFAILP